jgi:hypothetical protein
VIATLRDWSVDAARCVVVGSGAVLGVGVCWAGSW